MAMDNFKEEIVVKKHRTLANITYYISWVLMIIFALIGVMNVSGCYTSEGFVWQALVIGLLFCGMAFLIWWKKDTLRVEYEYTFTNGDFDVSMVLNNSKRKYLMNVSTRMIESAGEVTHPSFEKYLADKQLKKHNWFLNRENKLYYIYFTKNSVRHLVILEMSDEMVELMRSNRYMNYGVWQG